MSLKTIKNIAIRYELDNLSAWQRGEVERAMLAAYRAGLRRRVVDRKKTADDIEHDFDREFTFEDKGGGTMQMVRRKG